MINIFSLKNSSKMENKSKAAPKTSKVDGEKVSIKLTAAELANPELAKNRRKEYFVPANELDSFHIEQEQVRFASVGENAGQKISPCYVQKYDARAWENFRKMARSLGWSHVRVLWAPKGTPVASLEVLELKKTNPNKKK